MDTQTTEMGEYEKHQLILNNFEKIRQLFPGMDTQTKECFESLISFYNNIHDDWKDKYQNHIHFLQTELILDLYDSKKQ